MNIERYSILQDLCVDKNFRATNSYAEVSSLGVLTKKHPKLSKFLQNNITAQGGYAMRMIKEL